MNRTPAALSAAVLASTLVAGAVTAGTASAATHRAVVVVHTTSKHKVSAPYATRPGTAAFKNTGAQPVLLVTPRHGAGRATLARDLNADTGRGFIKDFTVADALPARATTYLRLARGTYYLADLSRDEFTTTSITTLRVRGTKVNATVPKAQAVVVTGHDTLTVPKTIPTSSELSVHNTSTHLQELFVARVPAKVTAGQLNAFLAKPSLGKLYTVISGEPAFLAMLSPKARATSSLRSSAGRSLLIDFTVLPNGAEPKFKAGQVRLVTVR